MGTPRLITSCRYHTYSGPKATHLLSHYIHRYNAKYLATPLQVLTKPLGSQPPSYTIPTPLPTPLRPISLLPSMA
jgi:hypothetical protein